VFVKTALFVTVADVTVDAAKASVNSVYGSYFFKKIFPNCGDELEVLWF